MDTVSKSNISRMYGTKRKDEGKPKVLVLKNHLVKIQPETKVKALNKSVMTREAIDALMCCDIVFSCLDRHTPLISAE